MSNGLINKSWVKLVLMLLAFGLINACTSLKRSNELPAWVQGESDKYPHRLYLTATGAASTVEKAKKRAIGNLSKIFEVHVIDTTVLTSEIRTETSSSGETVSAEKRLLQRVNVRSDKVLEGIEIVEQWQSAADFTYHVLAVINRKKAGDELKNQIIGLDSDTAFELDSIDTQRDGLKRVATYQRILRFQKTRSNINKTLKVIDLKGNGVPVKWKLVMLEKLVKKAISNINIVAYVESTGMPSLQKQLQAAISYAGFNGENQQASFQLVATIDREKINQIQGWYWLKAVLKIQLIDINSGDVKGDYLWALKTSAIQKNQLENRFRKEIDDTLKKGLKSAVILMSGSD